MCGATRSRSAAGLGRPPEVLRRRGELTRPGALVLALLVCLPIQPTGAEEAAADTSQRPTPRGALLRSGVLPGWGQYSNERPLKALLFATAAAGFLTMAVAESRALARARTPSEHESRAARRNSAFLYVAGTATFAALDAYVDAHLADFEASPLLEARLDRDPGGVSLRVSVAWNPDGWWRRVLGRPGPGRGSLLLRAAR